jgi:hypothetical protein
MTRGGKTYSEWKGRARGMEMEGGIRRVDERETGRQTEREK